MPVSLEQGIAVFVSKFQRRRLQLLRLEYCRIRASGVAALVGTPAVESCRILDLSGNAVGKAGVAALV